MVFGADVRLSQEGKMTKIKLSLLALVVLAYAPVTMAANFNVPPGDLKTALDAYIRQTGVSLMYSADTIKGVKSKGVKGELSADAALEHLLKNTGFGFLEEQGGYVLVRSKTVAEDAAITMKLAAVPATAAAQGGALETVTVTSSKIGGDVQNIPISITALSQEQLTATQTAGGPDLVKQVPNLTFS